MNHQAQDIATAAAESHSVGAILRAARRDRGMSLQELAAQSGVSIGMISQIERGRANPSMRLLAALRQTLNLSMQELFGETVNPHRTPDGDPDFVRRAADRAVIDLGLLQKELLTPRGRQDLQIMLLKLKPGGHSGGRTLSYPAEKGGVVLSGEIMLSVNGQESLLYAGDSFAFDSAKPHSIRNVANAAAEVIWIIGAVRFDRHL